MSIILLSTQALPVGLFNASLSVAAITTTVPSTLPDPALQISAYGIAGSMPEFIEIYNSSSNAAALKDWSIDITWQSQSDSNLTNEQTVTMKDYLIGKMHTSVSLNSAVPTADMEAILTTESSGMVLTSFSLVNDKYQPYTVDVTAPGEWFLGEISSGYTTTGKYYSYGNTSSSVAKRRQADWPIYVGGYYVPPDTTALRIVEIYPHAPTCSPIAIGEICDDYVKLQNTGTAPLDLSMYRIRTGSYGSSSTSSNTVQLPSSPELEPGQYAGFVIELTNSGNWVWLEDAYGLTLFEDTVVQYPDSSANEGQAWSSDANGLWHWTQYPTPSDAPNNFGGHESINACNGLKLSEVAANYSSQFIEVYNASGKQLDISGCQIETNRSQTARHIFPANMELSVGEYSVVKVDDTDLTLTKTTSGTVYILSSDGSTEVDARSYENLDDNTSLALVGGTWKQTFTVSPGSANTYQQYPPCDAGYTRNELTGRCNRDSEPIVLASCGPGQYRSPETNRCRSLVVGASAVTPCGPGEYRNPDTNRCKKITSTESTLKPCSEGYERNPDTNRCRKVLAASTTVPSAGFPVEPIADSAQAFTAWWALGGVLFLGLGYAGWEWRFEITRWLKRASIRSES